MQTIQKMDIESISVNIAVVVSEAGTIRVAVADSNWIQQDRIHQNLLKEIREDRQLWSLKYVKVKVPYPVSREEII